MAAAPAPSSGHAALSRKEIEQIQTALDKSGAKIAADGLWGKKSEAALKEFQRLHHLKVSGQLDRDTRKQLDLAG